MTAPPFVRAAPRRRSGLVFGALALLVFGGQSAAFAQRDVPTRDPLRVHRQKHRELRDEFEKALLRAAEHCESRNLPDEAAAIRDMAAPVDLDALAFEPLPKSVRGEIRNDLPEAERVWRVMVRRAEEEYAKDLYLLSRRLINGGYASYALQAVREAASHAPDHRQARGILGFVRYGDEWVTPYTRSMLEKRFVWHDKFGWLPKAHIDRYEAGERHFKQRWMTSRQEAELRRDFANAWEVRTDHFLVKTNHSLERGVEVATALEDFHDWFTQAFAAFFQSPEQLRKLFESGTSARAASSLLPHKGHYYAAREEYVTELSARIPLIGITNGLYLTEDKTAYFFHGASAEGDSTLFHEATHQLLYESSARGRQIAEKEHFWVIEGIACYMESFRREMGGRVSIGDPRCPRFEAARYRRLVDKYYVPFQEFSSMGREPFQNDPQISKNYSQASGLAQFFMEYDGGRYRDALIEHLSQHYSVNRRTAAGVQSLPELTGTTGDQFDREYLEFMESTEKALRARRVGESR